MVINFLFRDTGLGWVLLCVSAGLVVAWISCLCRKRNSCTGSYAGHILEVGNREYMIIRNDNEMIEVRGHLHESDWCGEVWNFGPTNWDDFKVK